MLEELIIDILPPIISICELMGIFVVAVSALRAFWHYCRGLVSRTPREQPSALTRSRRSRRQAARVSPAVRPSCSSSPTMPASGCRTGGPAPTT